MKYLGNITLHENGRTCSILKTYRGHGRIQGQSDDNTYELVLQNQSKLSPSESCLATLEFLIDKGELDKGTQIYLSEGSKRIGIFEVI